MNRTPFAILSFLACTVLGSAACTAPADEAVDASEDELVATFDKTGKIDLTKTTHIMLVGDSENLGGLALYAATTRARRYAQLYPNDQIVLFLTEEARSSQIALSGSTLVTDEPFGNVAMSDLRRLDSVKLIQALDRFPRIASIDFYGHSSPLAQYLEPSDEGKGIEHQTFNGVSPSNIGILADNFARERNPYITLNGCNGAATVAPQLSKLFSLPVSGALSSSMFQQLMTDGRWYTALPTEHPAYATPAARNTKSYADGLKPSCTTSCWRMKPADGPYENGYWAIPGTGFQYGLSYYKFFCDFADTDACAKGMMTSLYSFPSVKPIGPASSEADVKDVLADYICTGHSDPGWFDRCKAKLFSSAAAKTPFSPMRLRNDHSLECTMKSCEQELRCEIKDNKYRGCYWVSRGCPEGADPKECSPKNTKLQTTNNEVAMYLRGHDLLNRL